LKHFKELYSILAYSYDPYIKIFKKNYIYKKKKITDFHKIILRNAVMIICIKNKKILLTKEFRLGLKKNTWGLPGGHIDNKETPILCAKRELLEETGLKVQNIYFLYNYTRNGNYFCGKDFIFYTNNFKKIKKEEKDIKIKWFTKNQVVKKIMDNEIETPGVISALLIFLYKKSNFFL
jgi:ADP-ribose pyrophosphatase